MKKPAQKSIQVKQALDNLEYKGDLIEGTENLVESVKNSLSCSYADIAKISKCSVPGVTRWRNNDKGKSSRLAPLITYAKSIVDGGQSNSLEQRHSLTPISDSIKSQQLKDIEDAIAGAMEGLLDRRPKCSLTALSKPGAAVKMEILLE